MGSRILKTLIKLMVERKIREVQISSGESVPHGDSKHIRDLEIRIAELTKWRDRQHKGSEARANYARLIQRLRSELKSARRADLKRKPTAKE